MSTSIRASSSESVAIVFSAIAALMAVSLDELENAHWWLAACAILLIVFPISGPAAPAAVANGLFRAALPPFHWTWLAPAAVVAAAWILEGRGRRIAALAIIAVGATAGVAFLKSNTVPELDRVASARNPNGCVTRCFI